MTINFNLREYREEVEIVTVKEIIKSAKLQNKKSVKISDLETLVTLLEKLRCKNGA